MATNADPPLTRSARLDSTTIDTGGSGLSACAGEADTRTPPSTAVASSAVSDRSGDRLSSFQSIIHPSSGFRPSRNLGGPAG